MRRRDANRRWQDQSGMVRAFSMIAKGFVLTVAKDEVDLST